MLYCCSLAYHEFFGAIFTFRGYLALNCARHQGYNMCAKTLEVSVNCFDELPLFIGIGGDISSDDPRQMDLTSADD